MAGKAEETLDAQMEQVPSDPWAAAFAALDKEDKVDTEEPADTGDGGGDGADLHGPEGADDGEGAAAPEADDGIEPTDLLGGPGDLGGADGGADENLGVFDIDVTEEQIQGYRDKVVDEIKERTITDVVQAYIRQGARHTNGRLGANINDPDVCKRDQDGVPRFYNPDTGREFTGDNPRRQAQEWVEDYNRELADAFNKTCSEYSQKLLSEESGKLAVIEFAPKYKQLDPMRRSMFESIIEDYEVTDEDGNIVSYSCDLDKALAAVNRQVAAIQRQYSQRKPAPAQPSGPVLDTPSSGGTQQGNARPMPKSLEEAMEMEQDQLLAKMKGSAR